ncbi:MAG: RidA family protein [Chloroflexi bacterium]|nr:RidA family protein [Chloroflexota bacterium]
MEKQFINPASMVKPTGYAHGVVTPGGRLLFLAGQPGLDANGNVASPGDIVAQCAQAYANLKTVIEAAGGAVTDVVKLTIYVTDKAAYKVNLKSIGTAYRNAFGKHFPAMTLVEIKSLFDDDALVEIDGYAVIGESPANHANLR